MTAYEKLLDVYKRQVLSLAIRFILDWNYAASENLFLDDRLFETPHFERNGREPVQIISSGPDSHSQELSLIHIYQICTAAAYHRI